MRVLLTRLSALGDIVHTWPLAEEIAAAGHELAWLVEEPFAPLVATHPAVSRTITVATRRWRRRPAAAATFREVRAARQDIVAFAPDLALDPQGLLKSAVWARWAGVPRRVGLASAARRERLSGLCYTEVVHPPEGAHHAIDCALALAAAVGGRTTPGATPDGRFLTRHASRPHWLPPGAACLLPATGGAGKAWPTDAFAALARRLLRAGFPVAVLWGPGEEGLARRVALEAPGALMAPPTTIAELAVALRHAGAVVGGDTGPVHLAAALGTPTVAVMVATDPQRNGVRGRRAVVVAGAASGGRQGRARTRAVREVSEEEVAQAVFSVAPPPPAGRGTIEA